MVHVSIIIRNVTNIAILHDIFLSGILPKIKIKIYLAMAISPEIANIKHWLHNQSCLYVSYGPYKPFKYTYLTILCLLTSMQYFRFTLFALKM